MRALTAFLVLIAVVFFAAPAPSQAQITIGFTIGQPPPPLPYYVQPPAPQPNYLWTPGYWGYGPAGYYWVPGTWVPAPQTGYLWTPGYWGYNNNGYAWNQGYWAPQVGYYGGINYGYGYPGSGFIGGQWTPGGFSYNTAVWPVNRTVIHNTYINKTVINRTVINRTSYNGGRGGIRMRPNSQQLAVARMHHLAPTPLQRTHAVEAGRDRNLYANVNHGKPPVGAVARPFNQKNLPPHFTPVTAADRKAAQA
ncbi:MAG TPA: YXWGXW repeat-containing protein, partial [Candidatus Baltobacteraceae bacterium]|nr:YXWGXW repeat-containing protein [Candidatus Baltobacteraceae bacterium]